jgi:2-polyprenyl-3-methyl-5-hydroxy-6-metoxy-1,4-benzoquinol methylase
LQENGFQPLGVDLDEGMLEVCNELCLPAERYDALEKLKELADESHVLISAFHIVEHVSFSYLQNLVSEALRVLKPAGLLILETPNAENLVVGCNNFYLDPTHERPIPHLLLGFLTEYAGFSRFKLLRLQEPKNQDLVNNIKLISVLNGVSQDYSIVAQKQGDSTQTALFDRVYSINYGIGLEDIAERYENNLNKNLTELKNRVDKTIALCGSLSQYMMRLQGASVSLIDASADAIKTSDVTKAEADIAMQSLPGHSNPGRHCTVCDMLKNAIRAASWPCVIN